MYSPLSRNGLSFSLVVLKKEKTTPCLECHKTPPTMLPLNLETRFLTLIVSYDV